jgi:hypothetical protein
LLSRTAPRQTQQGIQERVFAIGPFFARHLVRYGERMVIASAWIRTGTFSKS